MKRLRRWLLIAAVLVGLMAHVGAIRATALLYGKASTTTTTTTTEAAVEEETTEVQSSENNTSTKPMLTGIPQIDYIWDPNLPRELNGYNLSEYPFYSSVPPREEIDFKCDGLHDGFYAAVKHKCQLYHHCLYGVRYDFLCANFTAFDQKTFICHFVSEVDCKNSHKYFHRNDALYEPTTTTTTPAPSTAAPVTAEPVPVGPGRQRPGRPLRRPLRRRRPQVDYYYYDEDYDDDYYEERANRRRKQRPRTRRPDYDEEYDGRSYSDDERYNKRPYNREGGRDGARDSEEYDNERRTSDRPRNRNRPGDKRRLGGDEDRVERRKNGERKRPIDERRPSSDERRPQGGERRFKTDDRRSFLDDRRSSPDRPRIPPTKDDSDVDDTEEMRRPAVSGRRRFKDRRPIYDESPETVEDLEPEKRDEDVAPVVRPTGPGGASGSLFDRPRIPPKVSRPVPFNERKKFGYPTKKPTTTTTAIPSDDYYEDYDDLPAKSHEKEVGDEKGARDTPAREPASRDKPSREASPGREFSRKPSISSARDDQKQRFDALGLDSPNPLTDEEYDDRSDGKYRPNDRQTARNNPKREEQRDDFEVRTLKNPQPDLPRQPYKEVTRSGDARPLVANVNNEANKNTKNTEENVREVRPIVRVVKRPFLPSRGGSPYLPRGLQPVGSSAQKSEKAETHSKNDNAEILSSRLAEPSVGSSRRPVSYNEYPTGPRTTQAPQVEPPKSALDDIYDNEYDVTLNDALNPTLKPLVPNRGLASGFSLGNKFDRNRYTSPSSSFGYNSNDSAYSSTHIRRASIESPSSRSSSRLSSNSNSKNGQSRVAQTYYDDEEYDY